MTMVKIRPVLRGVDVATSTGNNKITLCSSGQSTTTCQSSTTCWQYDEFGQFVNNLVIVHDEELEGGSAVHNLKTGGLFIATGICEDGCIDDLRIPTYYVSKYNEKGRRMRMSIMQEFKCDLQHYNVVLKFYENEGENLCLAMVCYGSVHDPTFHLYKKNWKPKLDVIVKCFD